MFKKLKTLFRSTAVALAVLTPLAATSSVSAASISNNLCAGANLSTSTGTCNDSQSTFQTVLTNIVNIFSLVVGIVAVIMVIIGGFNYITSGGNEQKVSSAKSTILYAVIGLVIVLFAQVIVRFVIHKTKPS